MSILIILSISSIYTIGYDVERLFETVVNGRRMICATFAVRMYLMHYILPFFSVLGAKVIENLSSYLVMAMITIFLFIAPVESGLARHHWQLMLLPYLRWC